MKSLIKITLLSFTFFMAIANAHPNGHDKPQTIYEEQALTIASYRVKKLVENSVLEKSWATIKASSAVLKRRGAKMNWIISFDDPKQMEDKQKLFIFLSHTGYYLSTNFTGD